MEMLNTLIIDIAPEYIGQNENVFHNLEQKYQVYYGKEHRSFPNGKNTLVLSDAADALQRFRGFPIVGVEHGKKLHGIPYVVTEIGAIDGDYLSMVYARFFHIPLVIARNERILLRESVAEDVESLVQIYADPEYVKYTKPMESVEEEVKRLRWYQRYMYEFYGYGLWTVIEKSSGLVIGRVGIENCEIHGKEYQELGYVIGKEYVRKGYAFEACQMVLLWAQKQGMECLIARIHEKNIPSVRLAAKIGFAMTDEAVPMEGMEGEVKVFLKYI